MGTGSAQRTEYRHAITGELLAVVPDRVPHSQSTFVSLPKLGYMMVCDIDPPRVERVENNMMDCRVLHVIRVGGKAQ